MKFNVNFPRRIANKFKKIAKSLFPIEAFGILLGEIADDGTVSIEEIYFPPDAQHEANEYEVIVYDNWFTDAAKLGIEKGLVVIGDIHSHCFNEKQAAGMLHEPSEDDWRNSESINKLVCNSYCCFAVCRVVKKNNKLRATIKFWPVIQDITTKTTGREE
jgi:proteasome lid subunit RPN8/RPN11